MNIRKKTFSVMMSVGFLGLMMVFYAFKSNSISHSDYQPQTKWKNLKVLPQNISKDSLTHLMEGYSNALSVDCNYCHAAQKDNAKKLDFASDEKIEKEIARGMIKMTNDLNKNYFLPHFPDPKPTQVYVVNCVMCHRGASNPEKYLSKMSTMYKTYDPNRDNRKEKILEEMNKK